MSGTLVLMSFQIFFFSVFRLVGSHYAAAYNIYTEFRATVFGNLRLTGFFWHAAARSPAEGTDGMW